MISLLFSVVAAAAANTALVVYLADRLGPKASSTFAAGEFAATNAEGTSAAKLRALRVGNENVPGGAAKVAA